MLVKDICRLCKLKEKESIKRLTDMFEDWWDINKKVICIECNKVMEIDSDPPEECPYLLEHIVSERVL